MWLCDKMVLFHFFEHWASRANIKFLPKPMKDEIVMTQFADNVHSSGGVLFIMTRPQRKNRQTQSISIPWWTRVWSLRKTWLLSFAPTTIFLSWKTSSSRVRWCDYYVMRMIILCVREVDLATHQMRPNDDVKDQKWPPFVGEERLPKIIIRDRKKKNEDCLYFLLCE